MRWNDEGKVTLTIPVRNVGRRDGTEVVQLYLKNLDDPEGPVMQLRGFQRVEVKAGGSASVTLELTPRSFEWFDARSNAVNVRPGRFQLLYGNSSRMSDLKQLDFTLM